LAFGISFDIATPITLIGSNENRSWTIMQNTWGI
jgi:hypothetical protein